ncbi:MAG: MinD/ParA family protein, partial [Pseudonocardia sp.]
MPKRSFAPAGSNDPTEPVPVPAPPTVPVPEAPHPVAPLPVAPLPVAPLPVAPPPVAPLPVAPPPVAPPPVLAAPRGGDASELTEYTIVRRRSDRPSTGWRRAVHAVSGGLVNPGIGPDEQRRQELARRIRRPLIGPRQIAVASMKGGVGKTTVTALLGLTLAEHRG